MRLRLEAEATQARQSLADRKLIECARGVLMDGLGLTETDAFTRLRHAARSRDARLRDVV